MTDEEQKRFLLGLAKISYRELLVYRAFVEFVRMQIGDQDTNQVLDSARRNPAVSTQLDDGFRVFVENALQSQVDPEEAVRQWLLSWNPTGKPN